MALTVSALVLNFNGSSHLEACLGSLGAQTYAPLEIVVADNGSSDGSRQVVSSHRARWEALGRNHGFAKGNNLGLARCVGDVVIFVNNDMRFATDFVERLVRPLVVDANVFATDARQFDWDGLREIHLATRLARRRVVDILAHRPALLPLLDVKQEPVATTTPVLQACAANMAVRRNLFEALGGFDERLPAGWEDTEICWRAWLRGWPTLYVPDATCWHKASATSRTQDGSEVRFRGAVIGRLVFATRHLPWEHVLATWMASALGAIMTLARGRLTEAIERLKLIARCSTMAPDLLRDRSGLYRRGGKTPRAHFRVMMRLGSR